MRATRAMCGDTADISFRLVYAAGGDTVFYPHPPLAEQMGVNPLQVRFDRMPHLDLSTLVKGGSITCGPRNDLYRRFVRFLSRMEGLHVYYTPTIE